jgi:hypothetical protein
MKHADGSLSLGDPAAIALFESPNGRPRGEYSKTILRFCRRYAPCKILAVFYDGIVRYPKETLCAICDFLSIPSAPIDDHQASVRVNAGDPQPMPESLRARIGAAYQVEMESLAKVFGGYAAGWLGDPVPGDANVAMRLTQDHVDALERRAMGRRNSCGAAGGKIFCLSMQRSGTTSVGDWLEAHGFARAGSPTSVRLGWTRLWLHGRFDEIFSCPEFLKAQVLEDDPWWCPGFHRELLQRFPDAKFILLTRDPDEWFESLCHHSGGRNPGWSDVHARIYAREPELARILSQKPDTDPSAWGLLSITAHASHYKAVYERHTADVQARFAEHPEKLFTGRLDDPHSFEGICEFLGVRRNLRIAIPRSNARTPEMKDRLAAHLLAETS